MIAHRRTALILITSVLLTACAATSDDGHVDSASVSSALTCQSPASTSTYHPTPAAATFSGGVAFRCDGFAFDGTGSATLGAATGNFGSSDFTMEFWFRDHAPSSIGMAVLEKRAVCDYSDFWGIRVVGTSNPGGHNGELVFELDDVSHGDGVGANASGYNLLWSGVRVDDGAPHHVAYVRSGAAASVYIDGVLRGSRNTGATIHLENGAPLRMGASACVGVDGTVPLQGVVDRLHFYGGALSACEVAALASRPHGCPGDGPE